MGNSHRIGHSLTMAKPQAFLEFFAGGGMAHVGLSGLFDCAFANDIDAAKCAAYRANFGDTITQGDIWKLDASSLPEAALAWASFPCQDLSLAGARRGLNAPRSGAFWGFWNLIEKLESEDRAPRTLVLENVAGLLSSRGGRDFASLIETLTEAGYRTGAMLVDAVHFTPQSRPRLFVIAHKGRIASGLEGHPDPLWHPPVLQSAVEALPHDARLSWVWWTLPAPPRRNTVLADIVEPDAPGAAWREGAKLQRLIQQMAPLHRARFEAALENPLRQVGAVYRRIRVEAGKKIQRAEIRYDGLAGCLRTPAGGSSKQLLVITENGRARLRALSSREAARLMGCDDGYVLPGAETAALKLMGDGVCVPAVRWLGEHLLAPLAAGRRARVPSAA
jgi:DNA (cytosine-5)-methyltransferase 1